MTIRAKRYLQYALGALLMLVALNAFAGGLYAMAGAPDVPLDWLEGSPFKTYFVPGLFLFLVIGGSALFAAFAVFKQHLVARFAAFACGLLILSWLSLQVAFIGYVSWLQPATAGAGLLILLLSSISRQI